MDVGDERIAARTVLWAAGVTGLAAGQDARRPARPRRARQGRAPTWRSPGHPEVFVVGDLASLTIRRRGGPRRRPGRDAGGAARGRERPPRDPRASPALPFRYRDKGSLATIGRSAAVADLGRVKLSGLLAWLAWLFIHILFLIGFRNRLLVLFQWAWSYFTYDRGARLITGPLPTSPAPGRAGEPSPTDEPRMSPTTSS